MNYRKLSINYNKMMIVIFMVNNKEEYFEDLTIHICDRNNCCNGKLCKTLYNVSIIRNLSITIDKHMKWKLHENNLVMRLRILSYSFHKLCRSYQCM